MPNERKVRVLVLGRDGEPATGAMVGVASSTAPVPELALVTDEKGVVTLSLPEGRFMIEAYTQDGGHARAETVVGSAHSAIVELKIKESEP